MKNRLIVLLVFLSAGFVFSQEALKSDVEEYYYFLSLQGLADRPTLNYRTLSDSKWNIDPEADHPWKDNRLKSTYSFFERLDLRIYGPELFMSFNTFGPYGQNDGALWQGKGFNTSFTAGARLEAYGIEATFRPQLSFSQNMSFNLMQSAYPNPYGYFWSYDHIPGPAVGVDAPQRFGNKPFFTYDWGDTEIRYTWKTLTAGFGTQAIWLGPAYLNPILHSNNAPSYPKFDIGLRRQRVTIPWINWYAGDVEARLWAGMLTESDYFDYDPYNDRTMFNGLSVAYAPSFVPGLVLFLNRVCLSEWKWENLKYIVPFGINDKEDQKISYGASWLFPQIGFEIYGEFGVDDYGDRDTIPFHTLVYSLGLKKHFDLKFKQLRGELFFEFSNLEMSQDFQFTWPYSFYFHQSAVHGYTNRGQWLGAGIGSGGNSQYLGFKIYYPRGYTNLFFYRKNPDNNYLYKDAIRKINPVDPKWNVEYAIYRFHTICSYGVESSFYATKSLNFSLGFIYHRVFYDNYDTNNKRDDTFTVSLGAKYCF
jgi:hypothetical protein